VCTDGDRVVGLTSDESDDIWQLAKAKQSGGEVLRARGEAHRSELAAKPRLNLGRGCGVICAASEETANFTDILHHRVTRNLRVSTRHNFDALFAQRSNRVNVGFLHGVVRETSVECRSSLQLAQATHRRFPISRVNPFTILQFLHTLGKVEQVHSSLTAHTVLAQLGG